MHRAGRLFQEFVVDAYTQIEYSRLLWYRLNQKQIRADSYSAIQDAAANSDDLNNVGQQVVLPSSFIGGPRQMYQLYHDAMAIVRTCGKPDLFITMTCNPKWPELTEALFPGQDAQDRPDLVARVFKLKLTELLKDLYKSHVFGYVLGHVHVVEFQKRGLPHAHILLILDHNSKPQTTDVIDQMVSAEIPDQTLFPDLHETVSSFMLHGPCGAINPNSSCMQDGRCTKRYPRQYAEQTSIAGDGFPLYRRSSNGFTVIKGHHEFTNCDVMPFNSYLSAKFNCHINVEVAMTITAVKYLFKYVYKGHDRAVYRMVDDDDDNQHQPRNEIDEFVDARYISAPECVYRILSFPMHDHKPSVERLALHEKDNHVVTYNPLEETSDDVLSREGIRDTSLTAFFHACTKYPDLTANLLYPDVPSKFVLKNTNGKKEWKPRRKGTSVGRVYFCPPSTGERYYIRMLLYHVPGPTSFEYLRTVNGVLKETFQDACAARGLLETDDEWDSCLTEAATIDTGSQLRELFVCILLYNNPSDPRALFERHAHSLSDDCCYRLRTFHHIDNPSDDQIISLALYEIDHLLQQNGKSLSTYNLPTPSVNFQNVDGVCRIVAEEINYDVERLLNFWEQGYTRVNDQQREVLDSVTSALASSDGGVFFLDGPAGTGKTFVESLLLAYVRAQGQVALAVASSGIASILLEGGRTSHSRFKIPIDVHAESICNISAQSDLAKLLQMAKLVVWDEAPAQHRHCLEAVDRTLKDLRKSSKWFSGVTMVFAG